MSINDNKREYVHEIITDQPGWSVFFIGFGLSLFLGLALKSAFSPAKIHAAITQALKKVHPWIEISVSSSHLQLSHGIWPDFSVILQDVKMEMTQDCWMAPTLESNWMRLPISLSAILTGKSLFHKLEMDKVHLSLKKKYIECEHFNENALQARPELPPLLLH